MNAEDLECSRHMPAMDGEKDHYSEIRGHFQGHTSNSGAASDPSRRPPHLPSPLGPVGVVHGDELRLH